MQMSRDSKMKKNNSCRVEFRSMSTIQSLFSFFFKKKKKKQQQLQAISDICSHDILNNPRGFTLKEKKNYCHQCMRQN